MEVALPIVALGAMYVVSNNNSTTKKRKNKEGFVSAGKRTGKAMSALPNTDIPPSNYPVMNEAELVDTVRRYPNPNEASSVYLNQNAYELNERAGAIVGDNIQDIYSLSGNYMNSAEFKHNNMVPFNGGKVRGQIYNNNNAEAVLDTYAGTGSQMIKKIEQAPLFAPQSNVQWTYGMPNQSDFYQSRVNPGTRNNNVKPFESQNVGPGLGRGYTTEGSGGFNSGMEDRNAWLPKTVDELRVETNPREEYCMLGHEGPGQSVVKNVGQIGKVEKYNPDTFFINTQDRWLTTTGAEKAPQMISQEIFKTSHRGDTTASFVGAPNSQLKTASYTPQISQPARRPELPVHDIGHSVAQGRGPHEQHHNIKSHTNYKTNRSENCQPTSYSGAIGGAIGAAIAPIMDLLKGSRREEMSCNMRVYGAGGSEVEQGYVKTQGDVLAPTIRETTLYTPRGYINNQSESGSGAYEITEHQPISNQRDSTTDCGGFYAPSGGAGTKHGASIYDAAYRATTNVLKEKTLHGRTNHGNSSLFTGVAAQGETRASVLKPNYETTRAHVPQATVYAGPSTQTYGKLNLPQTTNQCMGCERIAPDILKAFKENPYTHSLTYAV